MIKIIIIIKMKILQKLMIIINKSESYVVKKKILFYEDLLCKKEYIDDLVYKKGDKIFLYNWPKEYNKYGDIYMNSCKDKNKYIYNDGTYVDYCPITGGNKNIFYIELDIEYVQYFTLENPFYTHIPDIIENIYIKKYKCHINCNNY